MNARKRIDQLSKELLRHQHLYYIKAEPEISDAEYDRLWDELWGLEKKYPQWAWENSPTKRVGSDLDHTFPERPHTVPVLSLDKVYSVAEAQKWIEKIRGPEGKAVGFVVEEKIDGASIVLYYAHGQLQYALTRGNGFAGNDVTDNVRTIRQVPLHIAETAPLAVRGEIYITRADFERLNAQNDRQEQPYANPRNLAAGTLRNIRSSLAARVPLQIYVYEAAFSAGDEPDHLEALLRLGRLGFRLNPGCGFFCDDGEKAALWQRRLPHLTTGDLAAFAAFADRQTAARRQLAYEIDGLVIKVDQAGIRRELGYTAHHPRWAVALKFDAPQATTVLRDVTIQIGRNGRVTPVAELEPVRLAGSLISRATLHNQDYLDMLELGIGDQVAISKRGDVIPAVDEVLEKAAVRPSVYKIRPDCPFCGSSFVKVGAHLFCTNAECPERARRLLSHFAGKDQMDIETLGWKTIEFLFAKGFVRTIPDLYTFDYDRLLGEEGFKEKKIAKIKENLEKSKRRPFATVLTALGLEGIGAKTAEALIANGFNGIEAILAAAAANDTAAFAAIEGIGPATAELLVRHFRDGKTIALIEELRRLGLNFSQEQALRRKTISDALAGQSWVITGTFDHFQPRSKAAIEIERRSGKVLSAVTAKATHLLVGHEPGTKLEKAQKLGITIVSEPEFLRLIGKSD